MLRFQVEGMTCGHCVKAVTDEVRKAAPGSTVQVDLGAGTVEVGQADDAARVKAAIEAAGYAVQRQLA